MDRDRLDRLAVAATNLAMDAGAREAISALSEAGVRSLLIRGPAITRWLYQECEPRGYSDIDLLVAPWRVQRAERVLMELGFMESSLELAFPEERPSHASAWGRSADVVVVDLHRTLAGCNASPAEVWDELSAETETIVLEGIEVEIPNLAARAMIVALHAGEQGRELSHPADDLRRALGLLPAEVWDVACKLASRLEAEDSFVRGLRLLPAGAELAGQLGLPDLGAESYEPQPSQAFRIAHGLTWARSRQGLSGKARFLARKVFPTRDFMRSRSRLARRGRIGLALAYAARTLRLLRHTPWAMRGWRRSRRGT